VGVGIGGLAILIIAALATSALSAVIGMGGGILMLAVLFSFLEHGEAIPAHAAIQICSNGSRVLVYLRNVHWGTIRRFAFGALPGSAAGCLFLWKLGELGAEKDPYLKMAVGIYVLAATFLPKPKKQVTSFKWWDFPLLGFVAGTASLTVGAIGPLIAPLFARRDYVKEKLIATKAVCQLSLHVLKIPAFLLLGTFEWKELSLLTLCLMVVVVPGTFLGKRVQRHVSAGLFVTLYRIALTVAGVKVLSHDGLYKLLQS